MPQTTQLGNLEIIVPPKIEFMKRLGETRCEPAIIDSSMAQTFKSCPRKYFFRYVLGRDVKARPQYFTFGTAYHKFREVLENTKDFMKAMTSAKESFLKGGGDPPVGSRYDFLTLLRLAKSCGVAYERWQKERALGVMEVVAIEQPFNVELSDGSRTSGRLDQGIRWNGKFWPRDFKTTTKMGQYYQRSLDPNDQFSRYTFGGWKLSGQHPQGVIVEVLYNTKKDGPEIHQFLATRTENQLLMWEKEQTFWNAYRETCRDNDVWPMNENACWSCPFHSVCKTPTENMQMNRLEQDYIHNPWDNTKTEDDD